MRFSPRGSTVTGLVVTCSISRSRLDDLDRRIAEMRRAPTIFMRSSSAPPTCTTTGEHCQLIEHQQTAVSRVEKGILGSHCGRDPPARSAVPHNVR
ncbi:MAG: hypothetical protein M3O70_13335 [Actinomycetota bacterium]|nr:hypothetical protein [Actinomycetota bacterium]